MTPERPEYVVTPSAHPSEPHEGDVWRDTENASTWLRRGGRWVRFYSRGEREPLPDRRDADRMKVEMGGFKCYVDVGRYADGRVAEVFIDTGKQGTERRGIYAALAHAVSLGLQYGVPLECFVDAFTHVRFGAHGPILDAPEVGRCVSPVDAVFRAVALSADVDVPEPPKRPV